MADQDKNQGELSQELNEVKDELRNIVLRLDSMEGKVYSVRIFGNS